MATTVVYPVHVDAVLDPQLSRWLWLVKWVLVIPHYIVLGFLWIGFLVTSVIAFVAILVTGRYPRAIFTYNVGVLRWSWRVAYYAYGALGTDRYPPFTLAEVPDYPAHLSIDYPEHLSRGLVLVKWWLLAIPHYIVVAIFLGGGTWLGTRWNGDWPTGWTAGGLIGILVVIAAVIRMVKGTYPSNLYDVIVGMNRWALRVGAYAGLMTDVYPPFRLDRGGSEPDAVVMQNTGATPDAGSAAGSAVGSVAGFDAGSDRPSSASPSRAADPWTAGRIVALVAGSVLCLTSIGLLSGGVSLGLADSRNRDAAGFLTSSSVALESEGYAITTDRVTLDANGPTRVGIAWGVGTTRVRVTASDPTQAVFVGIAATSSVDAYLAGVGYSTVQTLQNSGVTYLRHEGSAPATTPGQQQFWAAGVSGPGTQELTWTPSTGDWTLVVMDADSSANVAVRADVAATVPSLPALERGMYVAGAVLLLIGALLVLLTLRATSRAHGTAGPTGGPTAGPAPGPKPLSRV
jgi:hypothetical protein